jgi:hypothetical protein
MKEELLANIANNDITLRRDCSEPCMVNYEGNWDKEKTSWIHFGIPRGSRNKWILFTVFSHTIYRTTHERFGLMYLIYKITDTKFKSLNYPK